jgi:phage terminase large subunit
LGELESAAQKDAIDDFLRARRPENAIVVQANWRDNPFFTQELEDERQLELKLYPKRYPHTWEGDYARAFEGAYYARLLAQAKQDSRIVPNLSADPLLPGRNSDDDEASRQVSTKSSIAGSASRPKI